MNIKIKINKWFNKYKLILSFIAIVIILFLLVMRGIDGKLEANNNSSSVLNTATIVENVENKNIVKNVISESKSDEEVYSTLQNLINSPSKAINIFIELCNNKKTALAYNMLSDECKIQLYPTEEEFINKYYNKIFNTPKLSTISIYNGNSYKVEFNEDSIITGRASEKNIEYITVKSDYKLNLSSFIQSNKINSSNQNEYLKLEVLKKHIYLNYEEYEIKIQNLTKADIYIDDIHNSQIYIADSNNKIFKLNIRDYGENDLKISGKQEKTIKLRFNRIYQKSNNTATIKFENVRIINKIYYEDNNINSNVILEGLYEYDYEQKITTYPNKTSIFVKL